MKLSLLAVTTSLLASACDSASPPPDPGAPPDAGGLVTLTDAAVLDDASAPDAAPDVGAPDAGVTCAMPPVQEYVGEQSERYQGGGSQTENRVEVRWTLTSTVGCVDHYTPSGLIYDQDAGPCNPTYDPTFGEIEPGDGELVIDRSTAPATYTVRGESHYQSTVDGWDACDDSPTQTFDVGGQWADSSGSFDGKLIVGGLISNHPTRRWHLVASDAVFTPPITGCSEPALERWTSSHRWDDSEATVTWTRVETTGCVDRYTPSGTATVATDPADPCTYLAPTHPIAADDGSLEVDRSTDPPTLQLNPNSDTMWWTERRCPGQEPAEQFMWSGWGNGWHIPHAFDGTRWSGAYETWSWSFAP